MVDGGDAWSLRGIPPLGALGKEPPTEEVPNPKDGEDLRGRTKRRRDQQHGRRTMEEGRRDQQFNDQLFPLLMRPQRRPLKKQHNFEAFRLVQAVRAVDARRLGGLLKLARTVLDAGGRSIFFANSREATKGAKQIAFHNLNIKTPLSLA